MRTTYIIDGEEYKVTLKDAKDIAISQGKKIIYILGKSNHWRLNESTKKWFLASGAFSD